MLSVGVGPFSLSIGHLLLVLAFIIALIVGALAGRKENLPISGALADIFLAAMLGARIGFVVRYLEHYQDDWLGIIDIRDGGFDVVSGLAVALVFTGYLLWRRTNIRRPLGFAVAAGLMTWGFTTGVIAMIDNQTQGLPDVALTDLNEQPVNLDALTRGKPTVVNLWATWCPPCIREMPVLEQAQDHYPGINFVFANQGEPPETISQFLSEQNLTLDHVLSDRQGDFGRAIGSQGLPTTLFYNAKGKLVDSHMGELSKASLARGLERFDASHLEPSPSKETASR
ncbi:TlpA family protein disulfide reductase [Marinobacter panjinensis]|uniref:TlpA family protein disulfide reductase n=1 Tax=Marinobacter panjinensis TaxID=2576384 RepID=A0A4U6R530_9GAMM|nr:TlpA disulfide reductase family protein [Marinobacter panjinensis]MCR8914338.1 TlpA family protein disulfide reductase [Marinobacter panjinensis]TKV68820.1 TlpA family protein disulfide reductase [Marinobacter panjinensis]